uniref:X-C motif chemokine receptor 1 n=1 Tax=Lepisosteus oculatus TaxID=7918 RepID=W5NNQ6_LEPOC|nr:PREDICTED: chemokine XC receptor 1-like [Lepisosteus oculatus]
MDTSSEQLSTTAGYVENQFSTYEYNDYYEDDVCNKETVSRFGDIITSVFFTLVIVLSVLGNLLVLGILAKYENLKSVTNIFILNLALSDLIFTFGLPFWASYHSEGWAFGESVCKAVNFIFDVGFYSSTIFLTMMTIHRYLAVVHPLADLGSRKCCYGITASVVIWLLSCLAAVPGLLFHRVKLNQNENVPYCEYDSPLWKLAEIYQKNIFFLVAFSIIIFCYFQILKTLLRSRTHTRYRTVRLIFAIVVVFFVGWAPYNVIIFVRSLVYNQIHPFTDCEISRGIDYGFYICRMIAFSHCCLNPFFYAFVGVKFRNHLKKLLRKVWMCQASEDLQLGNSRVMFHSHGEDASIY